MIESADSRSIHLVVNTAALILPVLVCQHASNHSGALSMVLFAHNILHGVVPAATGKAIEQVEHFFRQKEEELRHTYWVVVGLWDIFKASNRLRHGLPSLDTITRIAGRSWLSQGDRHSQERLRAFFRDGADLRPMDNR